jgi:hypothetical protein
MHGEVTSYSGTTLVVDVNHHTGGGTFASWVINLDGTPVDAITGAGVANRLAYFTSAQVIDDLDTATYPSLTELARLKGVTSPIQTQLDAKVPSLSKTTGGVGVASVSNLYSNGILVPEGTFTAGMMPFVRAWSEKSATNGNFIIRLYVNDTNDLAGSPILLATSTTFGASTRSSVHQRLLNIIATTGAGTKVQNTTFASNSDLAQFTTAVSTLTIDWTTVGGKYIVASAQNGSASDTTTVTGIKIDL